MPISFTTSLSLVICYRYRYSSIVSFVVCIVEMYGSVLHFLRLARHLLSLGSLADMFSMQLGCQ